MVSAVDFHEEHLEEYNGTRSSGVNVPVKIMSLKVETLERVCTQK